MPYVANRDIFSCAKGLPNGHPEREEIVYLLGTTVPDAVAESLAHAPLCGEALFDANGDRIGVCRAESTHGGHFNDQGRCPDHKTDEHEPLPERRFLIEDGWVSFVGTALPPAPLTHAEYIRHLAERIDAANARIVEVTATPGLEAALPAAPEITHEPIAPAPPVEELPATAHEVEPAPAAESEHEPAVPEPALDAHVPEAPAPESASPAEHTEASPEVHE